MNASVNTMISPERHVCLSNDIYIKTEDVFDDEGSNVNCNSNTDLSNEKINNKYMVLMNKGNCKERTDRSIEFKYGIEEVQSFQQNCRDSEENVIIIKEEIVIPDALESDQQSNEFIREDVKSSNKTINWSNAKSILKPKICKFTNRQDQIPIINKTNNNFYTLLKVADANTPPCEETVDRAINKNKTVPVSFNNESVLKVGNNIQLLESELVSTFSRNSKKEIAKPVSPVEVLKTVKTSRKHPKQYTCVNGFLSVLKNITKLEEETQTHEGISNHRNHSEEIDNNTLNIKIENVVSHATSLLKNTKMDSPSVKEKSNGTNPVSQAKSILKPKIHILDTKSNKIIIKQSESRGRTEFIRAKKIVTPMKIIEQIRDKCALSCTGCSISETISWKDETKKCEGCFKKMKFKCLECDEVFSSSVQFYIHDVCSCKVKIESGYYWKCNHCNYLVHKMTNCHENFCKKHPLLKCKYCSSDTIHLSEFTKYSTVESPIKKGKANTANSIVTDKGIELQCTPLSSMPGQELNKEKRFVQVCPGCKHQAPRISANSVLCSDCGQAMRYKCLRCEALLKTYTSINRHCSRYCTSERTYYCASCDVFTQQRYDVGPSPVAPPQHRFDGAPVPAPPASSTHRCRNCLARFDSRGKLNAHRRSCGDSPWLQCGLCPFKLRSPTTLRDHLEEVHRQHTSVAQRARVFKVALQAWRRSAELLKWKAEKISESEGNRLKDRKTPLVLLERLADSVVHNLKDSQELWTYEGTADGEDILPNECVSITFDEVDDKSTVDRPSFFNSRQTAFLNNINSLLEIPDSDEEVTEEANNWSFEKIQKSEIPSKTEKEISHNMSLSRGPEKIRKQKVPVERPTSKAKNKRRAKKPRVEPLRCEHCSYLTDAKKELLEHIMGRHAARLFRGVGFDCPRCSCVFNNYHIYERHLQSRHRL